MSEAATKADIERLYDKLEPMATDIAVIKTKLFDHLDDARDTKRNLRRSVISALVGCAKMAIIFLLASWVISLQGCTNYSARIEIPVLGPDGVTVVATKTATIDMSYLAQDKTFKRFEIDPVTGKVILENFGSETSQAIEAAINKIP